MSEVEKLIPTKRIAESILRISNGEVSTNLIEQLATDYLAADKEIATKDEQNRLTCCAIADMTPASEYSDAIEDAMSEWDAVKIARLVIAEYKFKLDCEAARIATKDAELAQLREALEVANQLVIEVNHAYTQGPEWYTRGESGLRQQVAMWIDKASKAIQEALKSQ